MLGPNNRSLKDDGTPLEAEGGAIPGGGIPALLEVRTRPGGGGGARPGGRPGGPSLCLVGRPGGGGVLRARGGVLCPLLSGGPPRGGKSLMFIVGLSHLPPLALRDDGSAAGLGSAGNCSLFILGAGGGVDLPDVTVRYSSLVMGLSARGGRPGGRPGGWEAGNVDS